MNISSLYTKEQGCRSYNSFEELMKCFPNQLNNNVWGFLFLYILVNTCLPPPTSTTPHNDHVSCEIKWYLIMLFTKLILSQSLILPRIPCDCVDLGSWIKMFLSQQFLENRFSLKDKYFQNLRSSATFFPLDYLFFLH